MGKVWEIKELWGKSGGRPGLYGIWRSSYARDQLLNKRTNFSGKVPYIKDLRI